MITSLKLTPELIEKDPAESPELLKRYEEALARQRAIPRSWNRVFVAAMATILCLSVLALAISISVASLGVSVPFVAAGLALVGLTLTENAIVAAIGFGLVVPAFMGFSAACGMYAVKHVPRKEERILLPGINP